MGQALKVIKFNDDDKLVSENSSGKKSNAKSSFNLFPLKVAAIVTAILGVLSLILEVNIYFQYRYEIYLARLFPTIISFVTLILLQSTFGKKKSTLITHLYLFSILASLSFVVFKVPSLFIHNIAAASIFVLILSLFINWGKINQAIVTTYFILLFGSSAVFGGILNYPDSSIFLHLSTSISILIVSLVISHLQTSKKYRTKKSIIKNTKTELTSDSDIYKEIFEDTITPLFQIKINGDFEYANSSLIELLEISNEDEITEINFFNDLLKNEKIKNHLLKKIESKGKVENYRLPYIKNDGSEEVLALDCKSKIINEQVFLEGTLRCITVQYQKDLEIYKELETLKKSKNQNPNTGKNFAGREMPKSNVISKMGHELRTPMNSVLGFLTLIENGLFENEEELKEFSHSAKLSAESLLGLLNDVVEIAKIQEGSVEIVNDEFIIREGIDKIIATLSPHLKQNRIKFLCNIAEDVPENIILDQSKYFQILTNLLRNAIQKVEDGEVTLSVSKKIAKGNKEHLVTSITDTGKVIPQIKLDKLLSGKFDSKDKDSKITSGVLHIMICKELITLLDGTFTANSDEKNGTRFNFTVDLEGTDTKVENNNNLEGLNDRVYLEGKPKLLLVEDNPISRKVETKLLNEAGYNVDCVENGNEAVENVKKGIYDLILMDIELKDMDGLEATKIIRGLSTEFSKIPIIAVTAHSSMKDREKCLLAGMNDYISKPINITFLKMTIDQWLNEAKSN
jgi:CheY-like chemotaxis protein/PAS domain-containing protein